MSIKGGRFSRWSRLKHENQIVNSNVQEEELIEGKSEGIDSDISLNTYSNDENVIMNRKRPSVPFMRPLAGFEEGDTDFESPPIEAMEMLKESGKVDQSAVSTLSDPSEEEANLSAEEREIIGKLPPMESLTKDSDFTPFLEEKVPEFIRRKALKLLWRSDPILANLDGLNDYDEDFNLIDKLINAATDSIYKVGKGMTGPDEDELENQNEVAEEVHNTKNLSKAPISENLETSQESIEKTLDETTESTATADSNQLIEEKDSEPSSFGTDIVTKF
jgi:hypothetical protein